MIRVERLAPSGAPAPGSPALRQSMAAFIRSEAPELGEADRAALEGLQVGKVVVVGSAEHQRFRVHRLGGNGDRPWGHRRRPRGSHCGCCVTTGR